jgi:ribosomal protein L20A (L18A)
VARWEVSGAYLARRAFWQPFRQRCVADSAEGAREWALSRIGGCHGIPRRSIRVDSVEAMPAA